MFKNINKFDVFKGVSYFVLAMLVSILISLVFSPVKAKEVDGISIYRNWCEKRHGNFVQVTSSQFVCLEE